MNKEIKQRWVEALRSGAYKQGGGYLNTCNEFCCLGVLCEILKEDLNLTIDSFSVCDITYYSYNERTRDLPIIVKKYTSVTGEEQDDLINLNDIEKKSFNEIADYIEERL